MQMKPGSVYTSHRGALDFLSALEEAQEHLDWGTDIEELRAASWTLALFDPGNILVQQLDRKVGRLVSMNVRPERSNLPRA